MTNLPQTQPPQSQPVTSATRAAPAPNRNVTAGARISAIVPRDLAEAARLVDALCVAGMIPASYDVKDRGGNIDHKATKARMMIGLMKAMEVGFPPITGLNTIMIINNRASIWGDGAVALVQDKNVLEWQSSSTEGEPGKDSFTVIVQMKRKDQEKPYEGRFSISDAKRAKLWQNPKKQPWMMYPERMLFNRARAFALRDGFADCLNGLSIAEEALDIHEPEAPKDLNTDFLNDEVIIPQLQLTDEQSEDMPAVTDRLQDAEPEPVKAADGKCTECGGKGSIKWQAGNDSGVGPCQPCSGTGKK